MLVRCCFEESVFLGTIRLPGMGLTFNSSLFIVLEVIFSLFNLPNAMFSHQLISVTK